MAKPNSLVGGGRSSSYLPRRLCLDNSCKSLALKTRAAGIQLIYPVYNEPLEAMLSTFPGPCPHAKYFFEAQLIS